MIEINPIFRKESTARNEMLLDRRSRVKELQPRFSYYTRALSDKTNRSRTKKNEIIEHL